MRQIATRELGSSPSVIVMDGSAEKIKLPENSIDLITVAQSNHWFDPEPAKQEMLRILKKNGWLVILRNYGTDENRGKAIGRLMTEEYGADFSATIQRPTEKPVRYYYGNYDFQKMTFSFQFHQSWEEFIGAITSASYMSDEDNPLFKKLEREAKKIFSQYSNDGFLLVQGETELFIGQPSEQTRNAS
jgi:SAM-dependent methyltransferase